MSERSKGGCRYCGKEYTKSGMIKHLSTCKQRQSTWSSDDSGEKQAGYFSLSIEGTYCKEYWLVIEIKEEAKLKDLDQFLRDIWLECCGHLSAFRIDGVDYDIQPEESFGWGPPSKSMNVKLKNILREGMSFDYEYDFGSTTELKIRVVSYRKGHEKKSKIEIMARNKPIEQICDVCGKRAATVICTECLYDGEGLLCDVCKRDHECGEEMLLPVVNSPRCGVCGYEGSIKYPNY